MFFLLRRILVKNLAIVARYAVFISFDCKNDGNFSHFTILYFIYKMIAEGSERRILKIEEKKCKENFQCAYTGNEKENP